MALLEVFKRDRTNTEVAKRCGRPDEAVTLKKEKHQESTNSFWPSIK